jgi:hypothetical protein
LSLLSLLALLLLMLLLLVLWLLLLVVVLVLCCFFTLHCPTSLRTRSDGPTNANATSELASSHAEALVERYKPITYDAPLPPQRPTQVKN